MDMTFVVVVWHLIKINKILGYVIKPASYICLKCIYLIPFFPSPPLQLLNYRSVTQPLRSSKTNKPTLVRNHPRSQIPLPQRIKPQSQTPSPSHHCRTTRDLEGCGPREQSLPWSSSSFSPWFPMIGRYRGSVPDMVRGSAHTVGTSPLWRRCLPVLCLLHFLLCWT